MRNERSAGGSFAITVGQITTKYVVFMVMKYDTPNVVLRNRVHLYGINVFLCLCLSRCPYQQTMMESDGTQFGISINVS
jgi:hypothetical protein